MYDFFRIKVFSFLQPTTYNLKSRGGFTLIELLVVVAIIGILSVVSFATFSGVRGKARDAVRISGVSQMQTIILIENSTLAGSRELSGCSVDNALTTICSGVFIELASFEDPLYNAVSACIPGSVAGCDYSISTSAGSANARTEDYEICFWLEDRGSVGLTTGGPGLVKVIYNSTNTRLGNFSLGCI